MENLRCARCGGLLSPMGQGRRNGYKLVPRPEKLGTNEYVHEDEVRCQRLQWQKGLPIRGR